MGKYKTGPDYYKRLGLKPMVIHLSPALKSKLKAIAQKEERSLQVTVRRGLEKFVKSRK